MLRRQRQWRYGFSLAELALVISLIAILSAIGMPRYTSATMRYRLDAAARRLAADLTLARTTARSKGKPVVVSFDAVGNVYTMTNVNTLDNRSTNYLVKLGTDPYYVAIESAVFGSGSVVTFDIYGSADNAGTVVLKSSAGQRTISLENTIGKVSMQ